MGHAGTRRDKRDEPNNRLSDSRLSGDCSGDGSVDCPAPRGPARSLARRYFLLLIAALVLLGAWFGEAVWHVEWVAGQESPTDSPLATPTGSPSPTPTKVPRTVNEIIHPGDGDAIAGQTEIIGTGLIADFQRYDVHISRAGEDRWSWAHSSAEVVHDNVLVVLNTRGYADGRYDVRVRAVSMRGQFSEAFVNNLEIRNAWPPTPTPDPNAPLVERAALPTPTPTPDMTARMPGGTGLYAPDYGSVLRNTVDIVGAVGDQFRNPITRWDVAVASYGTEEWSNIGGGSERGMGLTLATLDTTQYEDGLYDVRLRVSYQDGNSVDYFLRQLSIANTGEPQFAFLPQPGISAPQPGATLEGLVGVTATIPKERLMHWELALSRQNQETWTLLTTGDQPTTEGEIARLDLSRLVTDTYDLRLRIVRRTAIAQPESDQPGSDQPEPDQPEPEQSTGPVSPLTPNSQELVVVRDYFVRGLQVRGQTAATDAADMSTDTEPGAGEPDAGEPGAENSGN